MHRSINGLFFLGVFLAVLAVVPAVFAEVTTDGNPSASGQGSLTVGGELRTFSFTAVQHQDGTATGEALPFFYG